MSLQLRPWTVGGRGGGGGNACGRSPPLLHIRPRFGSHGFGAARSDDMRRWSDSARQGRCLHCPQKRCFSLYCRRSARRKFAHAARDTHQWYTMYCELTAEHPHSPRLHLVPPHVLGSRRTVCASEMRQKPDIKMQTADCATQCSQDSFSTYPCPQRLRGAMSL